MNNTQGEDPSVPPELSHEARHEHEWGWADNGVHWCRIPGCREFHDWPCGEVHDE